MWDIALPAPLGIDAAISRSLPLSFLFIPFQSGVILCTDTHRIDSYIDINEYRPTVKYPVSCYLEIRKVKSLDRISILPKNLTYCGNFTFCKNNCRYRLQTCVDSFVNLEVFGPGEDLAAAWVRTRKRFFSGVNAHVIDKFVLGFERLVHTFTSAPVTRMIRLLCSSDVIHRQMCHQLHH